MVPAAPGRSHFHRDEHLGARSSYRGRAPARAISSPAPIRRGGIVEGGVSNSRACRLSCLNIRMSPRRPCCKTSDITNHSTNRSICSRSARSMCRSFRRGGPLEITAIQENLFQVVARCGFMETAGYSTRPHPSRGARPCAPGRGDDVLPEQDHFLGDTETRNGDLERKTVRGSVAEYSASQFVFPPAGGTGRRDRAGAGDLKQPDTSSTGEYLIRADGTTDSSCIFTFLRNAPSSGSA